jgi:hypothetical protein
LDEDLEHALFSVHVSVDLDKTVYSNDVLFHDSISKVPQRDSPEIQSFLGKCYFGRNNTEADRRKNVGIDFRSEFNIEESGIEKLHDGINCWLHLNQLTEYDFVKLVGESSREAEFFIYVNRDVFDLLDLSQGIYEFNFFTSIHENRRIHNRYFSDSPNKPREGFIYVEADPDLLEIPEKVIFDATEQGLCYWWFRPRLAAIKRRK